MDSVSFHPLPHPQFHLLCPPLSEGFRMSSGPFRSRRSRSALSAWTPTVLRTLSRSSEPRAQARPSGAEHRRAQPHRLFQPRLGAVHHLQRLKPHPAQEAEASTGLPACHGGLQTCEVLKPSPKEKRGGAVCISRLAKGSRQMQHAPCCKEQFPRPRLPIHLDCTSPRETPGQITGGSEG